MTKKALGNNSSNIILSFFYQLINSLFKAEDVNIILEIYIRKQMWISLLLIYYIQQIQTNFLWQFPSSDIILIIYIDR